MNVRGRMFPNISCASTLECVIRFVDWARSSRELPSPREIADFLGCSRATAWRYRKALEAAQGATS
jgi:hypothetical protein